MGELEDLKEKILKGYEGQFVFFQIEGPLEDIGHSVAPWAGEDYKEFLVIAKKLGAKQIYYSEAFEDEGEHGEDIAELDLGFLFDDTLHLFHAYADWYEPDEGLVENQENSKESLEKHIENTPVEELANEILDYAKKENISIEHVSNNLYRTTHATPIMDAFLAEKKIDRFRSLLTSKTRVKLDRVTEFIESRALQKIHSEEKETIPPLTKECVEWAKQNGFNKLTRANLNAFLSEKDQKISSHSQDILYTRVNSELKKK